MIISSRFFYHCLYLCTSCLKHIVRELFDMERWNKNLPPKLINGESHTIICVAINIQDVSKPEVHLFESQPQNVLSEHWQLVYTFKVLTKP